MEHSDELWVEVLELDANVMAWWEIMTQNIQPLAVSAAAVAATHPAVIHPPTAQKEAGSYDLITWIFSLS